VAPQLFQLIQKDLADAVCFYLCHTWFLFYLVCIQAANRRGFGGLTAERRLGIDMRGPPRFGQGMLAAFMTRAKRLIFTLPIAAR